MTPDLENLAEASRVMEARHSRFKSARCKLFYAGARYGLVLAIRIVMGDKDALAELRRVEFEYQGEK